MRKRAASFVLTPLRVGVVSTNGDTSHSVSVVPRDSGREELDGATAYCQARLQHESASSWLEFHWIALFQHYNPLVRHIARMIGVLSCDLDDCVQEVWIELVRRLAAGQYDSQRGRFYFWFCTLARNRTIDFLRMAARKPAPNSCDLDLLPSQRELDPAETFERKQHLSSVHAALAELHHRTSPATFQTLYRHWVEGEDSTQVARELGLTRQQARYRRSRAKQCLRKLLNRHTVD